MSGPGPTLEFKRLITFDKHFSVDPIAEQLLQQQLAAQAQQNKGAVAKKPVPAGAKPVGKENEKNPITEEVKKNEKEVETNELQILPASNKSPLGADQSAPLKPPAYYPRLFFYQSEIVLPNEMRTFSAFSSYMITTGVYAIWVGNRFLEYHALIPLSPDYIPIWIVKKKKTF